MLSLLSKDRIIAPAGFNRWKVPPASVAIHLCIGSVYAWTKFNTPLQRVRGVVTEGAEDWSLALVNATFTIAIAVLGLSAAFAGKWLERVGPRMVGSVAALCWGGGFLVGGLGIWLHQLWLLYLGYGVIGGCGLGLGYVSPVSTLIKWFPDRRGMAAGMAIMGFGGGAIIGAPLKATLLDHFYREPVFLGAKDVVRPEVDPSGGLVAVVEGEPRPVVVISAEEGKALHQPAAAGVYLAGTGSSGGAETFVVLGLVYFVVMVLAAFSYRVPAVGWRPVGWNPPTEQVALACPPEVAVKTPQFWLLWVVLCFNVTAGIGVLGLAADMLKEIFRPTLPEVVTSSFTTTYVLMISVFNMLGRFVWSSLSDYIGRQRTYALYFLLGIPLYLSIPWIAHRESVSPAEFWLVAYYAATMLIFTMYGGGFATIPAYLADLFGTKYVGAIHGRLLTAWSTAGVLGPLLITQLRQRSLYQAIHNVAANIESHRFLEKFGAPLADLDKLVAKKTVTLSKLMEIAPSGTIDPSANLYNTTMYVTAALLAIALVANTLVRPVDQRHFEQPGI
jgi:MFS family permease